MEVLTLIEAKKRKEEIIEKIRQGMIFIYPTDTIYGIGCNALIAESVDKVNKIKNRPNEKALSIWAPSREWILEHVKLTEKSDYWIGQLPGPYTLLLETEKQIVAANVAPGKDTLGVRLPDHWFHSFVQEAGVPIVTTSVNIAGNSFMTSLEDLDPLIERKVEFCVYEGPKEGRPSKIVRVEQEEIVER